MGGFQQDQAQHHALPRQSGRFRFDVIYPGIYGVGWEIFLFLKGFVL